ncbi:MAG: chitobiase/beta-hexosaminidase C-terminal domain-containing protein [Lachnospiraceae bacterium]|nr:chitobiase/beta-hexosaminidase C-terminal domain-containing protein [Lachnospiraceae bacterium]
MKKRRIKALLCGLVLTSMLSSSVLPAWATTVGNEQAVTVTATELTAGLLAHYDFEEAVDTSVPNKQSAENYTATLEGSNTSIAEDELFGKVLKFTDGTDGYMKIPQIMNASSTSYSISLWYKYDASAARAENIILLQQSSGGRTFLLLTPGNKYGTFVNQQNKYSNATIDPQQWQWVMITYDTDANKVKYYINGVLDSEQDAGTSEVNELTDLMVGKHKNSACLMRGMVDEIRVYNKVVTDEEAAAIYQEKAGAVLHQTLLEEQTAAQAIYDSGRVDASEAEAVELKTALDEAAEITAEHTYAEIQEAIEKLKAAVIGYKKAVGNTLTIDVNTVERTLEKSTIGINHRYAFNGYGSFDSTTMTMKEDFVELYKEAGFGSIRYPGGTISNLFQWKNSIGPKEERVKQIHGFYNNAGQNGIAPNFGLTEVANFAYDDEIQSEIVYVYGFGRGSAQDAADLVEYLNAPVGCNPNGGVEWARIRANNGREEPYNVRHFEIGNENQQAYGIGSDGTASQGYWLDYTGGAESAYVNGGTAHVTKQYAVRKDNWNRAVSNSDGTANQTRYMRYANPNPMTGEDGKTLVEDFEAVTKDSVHIFVNDQEWQIVESLEGQAADAEVVTVDYRDGSFTFGNGTNGKIPENGATITVSYSVQRDGFVQLSQAMRAVTDEINTYNEANNIDRRVECYLYSSFETTGFINKMAEGGYDDLWDGFTIHPYSNTPSGSGTEFYDSAMLLAEQNGIGKVQKFVDMLPEGKVPVISEYGIFRSTNPLVRSQTHAIYIAKVMMEYVRFNSPYIQKHCLIDWYSAGGDSLGPTQQAVIQAVAQQGADTVTGEGEYRFFSTPSAKVFEMLKDGMGTEVVASSFSEEDKLPNGTQAVSALASKDEAGNLYLNIVNTDREDSRRITIDVEGVDNTGAAVVVSNLVAPGYDAENTLDNPDNVRIVTESRTNETAQVEVTIAPHTFTVVKIEAPKVQVTVPSAPQEFLAEAGDGQVTLSWTAPAQNGGAAITGYEVSCDNGSTWTAASGETGHSFTGLENGKEYTLKVRALNEAGAGAEAVATATPQATVLPVAATPVISPAGGSFTQAQTVEITSETEGAAIYYTLDGEDPTEESTVYNAPITVEQSLTLKAIAIKEGMTVSEVASVSFVIQPEEEPEKETVKTPTFSVKAGTYDKVQNVALTSATEGATIYYTTDGKAPTISSTKYSKAITVDKSMTIKAIAVKEGMDNSAVAQAIYVIQLPDSPDSVKETVKTPAFSVKAGTYNKAQSVTLTSATEGVAIYYTTDGKTPTTNSTRYSKAITVDKTMTIKAIAVKSGMNNSAVATAAYTIKMEVKDKEWIFTDVEQNNSWKHQGVKYVYNKDIMGAVGASTEFQPDRPLSRSMFATVLYRMAGAPTVAYKAQFSDVPAGKWYSDAIIWAYQNKIVSGLGDGSFGIDQNITREQIAKMLYEYANVCKYDTSAIKSLSDFTDEKEVSGWAVKYMQWATAVEMITGKPNDEAKTSFRMDPKGEATRAECAAMLMRFENKYVGR